MTELKTTSELGSEKIGKLLIRYAIPSIAAMLASSLYNIVDRAFIGKGVDALALSGLAVTLPLMNLSAAVGSLVGIGSSTMISIKLGQNDNRNAQIIFGNSVTLNTIIGITFGLIFLIFLNPILTLFGATAATIEYARSYMMIILIGNMITHLYFGLNCILRATGHPRLAMTATLGTVFLNTFLDYLFIMVFHWGIQGAAIATILSQALALIWQLYKLSNKKELIHLKRGIFRLNPELDRQMFTIGLSPCLMNAASCLVVLLINRKLLQYGGDYAIGAYSIVNSFLFMMIMIVMGFNQAMQPIAGYNWGAGLLDRVLKVLKITIILGTLVTTTGFLITQLATIPCIRIFTNDPRLTELASEGMHLVFIMAPLVGFQMVSSNFFQSIGMPGKSILMSLSRQLLLLVPCLLIIPNYLGTKGVWISLPIADGLSIILASLLLTNQIRKINRSLDLKRNSYE
jgi:putative MATE family efflux protein